MSNNSKLFQHLVEKFSQYTTEELIRLNNETVDSNAWGSSRATFRTAIISALSRKGIDMSRIIEKQDGFTHIKSVPVKLQDNSLIPLRQ
ncbi:MULTISPECIES: hypothetical protein [Sphingobacterium]|uniref:5-oxoprolinase n=1 Tax=Sphingobacterium thermophilum TaxID=768534 RepID=A0ABP8R3H2_9SPHI|nr:hypothetical protein [Sphingobacterium sp. T2]